MRIRRKKPNGFSLAAAAEFYASFVPGSGMAAADANQLTLAFRLDGSFDAVAVALSEADDAVELHVAGTRDEAAVVGQISRMLGLDADGDAWRDLGGRDPVVARLQREFPGFFTAAKSSPYDAATWAIIAQRFPMRTAASIKRAIARDYGDVVTLRGRSHHVFPAPDALRRVQRVAGLAHEKIIRLHGIADAAREGRLDANRLREMTPETALADLQALRGIGPWAASHVYSRGAAPEDALPLLEPRVLRGWGLVAGIANPTPAAFVRAAEAWRPFRMWVAILLARALARSGAWNAPGIARERAHAAGRASGGARAFAT